MTAATTRSRPRRRRGWGLGDRTLALAMVLPTAAVLLVLSFFPFAVAVRESLVRTDSAGGQTFGLDNYRAVLTDPSTIDSFGRTLFFVVGVLAVETALGLVGALLLNARLRGQTLARGLLLFPYVVPSIVVAILFRYGFNEVSGMVNYLLVTAGIVDQPIAFLTSTSWVMVIVILATSWQETPLMIIVFLARLQTLPRELGEAAMIDGAGRWKSFRYVTLPWLTPTILVMLLLRTIWTATSFDTPYLIANGGPLQASTVVAIKIWDLYLTANDIGQASALALVVACLLLGASAFYLRGHRKAETRNS